MATVSDFEGATSARHLTGSLAVRDTDGVRKFWRTDQGEELSTYQLAEQGYTPDRSEVVEYITREEFEEFKKSVEEQFEQIQRKARNETLNRWPDDYRYPGGRRP